jgi:signal transduction histidine kinase/ActR/RegA family two-component response regulator
VTQESERVLVVAPYGRDGEITVAMLRRRGFAAIDVADIRDACVFASKGDAGAFVIAEEAITAQFQLDALARCLDTQQTWSDLPLVVLASERGAHDQVVPPPKSLRRFNVTILERPVAVHTLVAAVEVALRARRRQYQVRSLLERAESANRAKDEFLAMLGHELRNPLSPIMTALHLVRQKKAVGCEHELMVVERQVDHLARLVDDLLDVSRIARGKIAVKREPLDLESVLARAVEMASPLFEQRCHDLRVDLAPNLGVVGDATRLAQVFTNLLTNAAKYTPQNGHVVLSASREGEDVVVRVRDDGAGIAREMIGRVFDMFVQERQTLDRSAGGLGLGLTIVRSLVQLHGGSVGVSSPGLGRGSEFVVRLPFSDAVAIARHTNSPSTPSSPTSQTRVLVVDDNVDAAEMLSLALESSGYVTRVAHDGLEALRVADELRPALAVLDIGLPVMDGYELARRLKVRHPKITLVALTGYGQVEDVRKARAAGFDEHLVKPVDLDRLQATVSRVMTSSNVRASA